MAGITEQGLEIKRLPEVRDDLRAEANEIFADLVPAGDVLDTSSASTLGRLIGIASLAESDLWEAIQEVYLAFDPNSATGIPLDNLVALAGIVRRESEPSTARVLLTGDHGITIPAGSVVTSSFTNNRFEIPTNVPLDAQNVVGTSIGVQTVTVGATYELTYSNSQNTVNVSYVAQSGDTELDILGELVDQVNQNLGTVLTANIDGNVMDIIADNLVTESTYNLTSNLYFDKIIKGVTVAAIENGPIEQATGTIDSISTPVLGWDSIQQIAPATVGSFRETDADLRMRFNEAKYTRGSNILDALYSDLLNLDGVQDIRIYENLSSTVDSNGLPPHSFRVLIRGGLEQEIGEAIWRNRPAGITTSGNVTVFVEDVLGNTKEVYLQRPEFVDIYVSVSVTTDEDFPPDGVEQIRSAIFEYIRENAEVGEDVNFSRLYTPVNSVPGHYVDFLYLDTSPSPSSTSNISIDFDQIAKLELGNIEVTAS